jgi:hypothetical protein
MKRLSLVFLFFAAFGMAFFTGCTSEEKLTVYDKDPQSEGNLTFILPMSKNNGITYGSIAPEGDENKIENLKIYWFLPTGKLHKVFSWPTSSGNEESADLMAPTTSGGAYTARISTGTEGGLSRFYILANVNSSSGISAISVKEGALGGANIGVTSQEDFEKKLSDNLELLGSDIATISCPLPMSVADTLANNNQIYVELDPTQKKQVTATLNRRVARFDILNQSEFTNFEIQKVYITNAKRAGFLQDIEIDTAILLGSTMIPLPNANGPTIAQKDMVDTVPTTTDPNTGTITVGNGILDVFDLQLEDTLPENKSQFYLWPTVLKADGANGGVTELVFEGIFDKKDTRAYRLELTNDFPILSNHVYKIAVKRNAESSLQIKFTIDEWEWEDDTLSMDRNGTQVEFSHLRLIDPAQGTFINGGDSSDVTKKDTLYYTSATPTEVHIVTTGYTLNGSGNVSSATLVAPDAKYGYLASDMDTINKSVSHIVTTTSKTYGLTYHTTHTIFLPPTDAPIAYEILVQSATNSSRKKHYYIVSENYAKTGWKPFKFAYTNKASLPDTLLIAPVNLGATVFDTTSTGSSNAAIMGLHYQWGRNSKGWDPTVDLPSGDRLSGPIAASAMTPDNIDKWIYINTTAAVDWLDAASENDSLWGEGVIYDPVKAQGPCSAGWRLPTNDELDAFHKAGSFKGGAWAVPCIKGRAILQPASYHWANSKAGTVTRGYYWSSTPVPGTGALKDGYSYYLRFGTTGNGGGDQGAGLGDGRAVGYSIRPVGKYIPLPNFE